MKILMITATYPPSTNGVAVSVKNIFEELKKKGHTVYVLAPENKSAKDDPVEIIRYPSIPNPLIEDYPIPLLPLTPKILDLIKKTKFDIVHAHHPFTISFIADTISGFENIPFVFTYHTRYGEYLKGRTKFVPQAVMDKIEKYSILGVLKRADCVLVPSLAIKKHLLKLEVKTPVKIVPSGIPKFPESHFSVKELRAKYKLPKDKIMLLCVCRIAVEKNIKLLLETMKLMPNNYFLVLAGMGPQLKELKTKVRKDGISQKVKFIGRIKHEKIHEMYKTADIFVFPSLTETQGLVMLEAESLGLPVVAVDCEVNREWVPKGCGVVSANKPEAFKKSIISVDRNKDKYSEYAKSFSEKFTLGASVDKLVCIYSGLRNSGKKSKPKRYIVRKKLEDFGNYMNDLFKS